MKWITFLHDGKPCRHIPQSAIADMDVDYAGWSLIYLTTGKIIAYKPIDADPDDVFDMMQRNDDVAMLVNCDVIHV